MGTQHQQCIDGEWSGAIPVCELIPEAPKTALQIEFEKALVSNGLLSSLFTAVPPGPGIAPGTYSVNGCSIWDVFEWVGLGLMTEWGS